MPAVVPLLSENVTVNAPVRCSPRSGLGGAAQSGSCCAMPLTWGDKGHVASIRDALAERFGTPRPDVIVAADVVYHEHLIEPLLDALVQLTDATPSEQQSQTNGSCSSSSSGSPAASDAATPTACSAATATSSTNAVAPPLIVIAYVQRFKRAKAFFKKARKWFDVSSVTLPAVVDYDVMSWVLPQLQRRVSHGDGNVGSGGGGSITVTDDCALYSNYIALLSAAAAAKLRDDSVAAAVLASGGSAAAGPPPPAPATVYHAVDSDSDSDAEISDVFAGMTVVDAASSPHEEQSLSSNAEKGARDSAADAAFAAGGAGVPAGVDATRAASILGVRQADPLSAYIYFLKRRK